MLTYVNNKSSSFHSTGVGYESAKYLLYQRLYNTNLDSFNKQGIKN